MTSPHLADSKPRVDPVEPLRLLVADLQALVDRLELKEPTPALQATLNATQERVCGPRAVVMLLGEHGELKRRFLERLLGPIALLPNPITVCTRLEYGAEAESVAAMPQGMQAIRLPNPTLKGGLAVIDTPPVENGEAAASVLEFAEQADAWIFVLNADHALSEASQALLRSLPERGARLEIVVENAEGLSGEDRLAARARLIQTLREHCNIETPRLTLVASAATEGDEGSFWHGRFATFHSVMMLRGREHWMKGTRAMVQDALSQASTEIDLELKSTPLGVRHARLRLGMKDLDGLRTRFYELGRLESAPSFETKNAAPPPIDPELDLEPMIPQPADAIPQQSRLDWSGGRDAATHADAAADQSPLTLLAEAIAAMRPENADIETVKPRADADAAVPQMLDSLLSHDVPVDDVEEKKPDSAMADAQSLGHHDPAEEFAASTPVPVVTSPKSSAKPATHSTLMEESAFVHLSRPAAQARPKRGVSVRLSEDLRRLMPHGDAAEAGRIKLLKRIAWVALLIVVIGLILWALAPRGFLFGQEPAAEWDFQQPKPVLANHTAEAAPGGDPDAELPAGSASSLPDTSDAATPNISAEPLAKHHGAVRTPLVHPLPSDATAGVPQSTKRHHRHLLGLGKLWHWVRHPHHGKSDPDFQ